MKYLTFDIEGEGTSRLIRGVNDIPRGALEVDESLWMRNYPRAGWRVEVG
ncbi:hypothetical protein [Pseudomonas brassicacearum]|jgi:hypothetical protein|nr:hypothetical protein [Pseudomonas brassicacearum]